MPKVVIPFGAMSADGRGECLAHDLRTGATQPGLALPAHRHPRGAEVRNERLGTAESLVDSTGFPTGSAA
ncbi:hypothetical protein GGQ91_005689 [Methylobacterium fujisawaense]|uniref:Uncharacterized protein n=1 Tax=Methylobacterium fujisawaense TaxID=107400 RepID=A0ABR6DJI2_9HYPH|nr:hypothetical protein [Methylobacterium fujisawaense]MBA9066261.1 hypothetical protein [Methylobacterium fujisawaense]